MSRTARGARARSREAPEVAKENREERERKEKAARQQLGVGLATQLIGYSHTQANLKKGMKRFLVSIRRSKRKSGGGEKIRGGEEELARKLEVIAQDIEKDPFDDDEDMDDAMLDLPISNVQDGGSWVDDDLDDDSLLQVHDLVVSDPVEEHANESISVPPRPATAPPTSQDQTPRKIQRPPKAPVAQGLSQATPKGDTVREDVVFTRTHGPVNRAVESSLEKLPGEIIELLSQDIATSESDWAPAHGLLYKLNPVGLPPHRLRIKVGCVLVCLRDLNTSSQLSKSQHVQILRVGNERLECLTLDGQLAGTKTVITRVPFPAKYRNEDKFPFTRIQYPVRVATDYVRTDLPRDAAQANFKLPSINGRLRSPVVVKRPNPPATKPKPQVSSNPGFKMPGLPASKGRASMLPKPSVAVQPTAPSLFALDGWDDFLETGTQIARELSAETTPNSSVSNAITQSPPMTESIPPLSTQDLDFSLDDLDDEPQVQLVTAKALKGSKTTTATVGIKFAPPVATIRYPPSVRPGPLSRTANIRRIDSESNGIPAVSVRSQKSLQPKSKRQMAPALKSVPPAKKVCLPSSRLASPSLPTTTTTTSKQFCDFGMSTQEASSFFDDDDDFAFGSPPIAV